MQRLAEIRIEARHDPRDEGEPRRDLYFDGHRIGGVDAVGGGVMVKIVSWPGLRLSGLVAVRVESVADLPRLRESLVAKMPSGFEDAISSDSERRARANREKGHRVKEIELDAIRPVDDATRLAWEENRRQAAFWQSRPASVTSTSGQTGSETQFLHCAKCRLDTAHVLNGQHSTRHGKNWLGWQCTVCGLSVQRPSG
ncbi:MAG: hypothetical protein ACYDHH_32630 [Solirubrobacteraceae bacterium]